jgi:DedD protein
MATENGLTENEDVRRKALLRLGMAAVVTATALAGLWWLDQGGGKPPEKTTTAIQPAPIIAAPAQESAPPQTPPDAAEASTESSAESSAESGAEATPATQTTSTARPALAELPREAPPPPKVSNSAKTPPLAAAMPRPRPLPPDSPAQSQPGAVGERFVVQLGVFNNPERARELVAKLSKQGIRAHMETRVQLGPFSNRAEADKAQVEMRKLGMPALVTPAAATR